jgi:hypothetical protein
MILETKYLIYVFLSLFITRSFLMFFFNLCVFFSLIDNFNFLFLKKRDERKRNTCYGNIDKKIKQFLKQRVL